MALEQTKKMVDFIFCPYCRYKGEPITEQKNGKKKNGKKKYLCPRCGNVVSFRRKK